MCFVLSECDLGSPSPSPPCGDQFVFNVISFSVDRFRFLFNFLWLGFENWRASLKQSWYKMDSSTSSNLEVCCTLTESGVNEIGPENGTSLQGFGKKWNGMVREYISLGKTVEIMGKQLRCVLSFVRLL